MIRVFFCCLACGVEKESVAIGVVEILSDHLKGTVFCVVGACVNDLKRGSGERDEAVETENGCLKVSGGVLEIRPDDLVLGPGHRWGRRRHAHVEVVTYVFCDLSVHVRLCQIVPLTEATANLYVADGRSLYLLCLRDHHDNRHGLHGLHGNLLHVRHDRGCDLLDLLDPLDPLDLADRCRGTCLQYHPGLSALCDGIQRRLSTAIHACQSLHQ